MKYFAILIDRNDFTKEIPIEGPVPYIHIPIINPGINRVFIDTEDYYKNHKLPSIEKRTFYIEGNFIVSKTGKTCWTIYKEY